MIVLDLICEKSHRFEGWFAALATYQHQQETGLLNCPVCGTHDVHKLPSAPHIQRSVAHQTEPTEPDKTQILNELITKLQQAAANSEDVGERFPDEVRKIHHGDAEERSIRGKATKADVESLWEEGISVLPVPPPKEDLH